MRVTRQNLSFAAPRRTRGTESSERSWTDGKRDGWRVLATWSRGISPEFARPFISSEARDHREEHNGPWHVGKCRKSHRKNLAVTVRFP